jgi:NADH-quinone oxidoreductase subunit N
MHTTLFLPELALSLMVLVLFFLSFAKLRGGTLQMTALILAAVVVVVTTCSYGQEGTLFFSAYRIDPFSQLFKIIITFGLFLIIYMGTGLKGIEPDLQPEYYMFLTLSTLGLVFLSSAVELLTIVISLEISSFSLYVMIPFRRQSNMHREHFEAGIKYILFGAAATGITLYGLSYIYGLAHTTYVDELLEKLPQLIQNEPLAVIGMILLLGGFFYKLAFFPMHFWAPDVYQGAANETTGFVATLPKVGAVALLIRLISMTGMELTHLTWILASFAILSMTLGNLSALVQNDLKRLLAYSTIAHAGYIMLGMLSGNELGMVSAIYYIAGYLLMNLTCFYVIYHLAPSGENIGFDDLKGLYRRSPFLAFTLAVGAFGLAGIPPTVGFTGKLIIFTAAIQEGFYGLVILAVINTGISAYFYLKMVRASYLGVEEAAGRLKIGFSNSLLGVLLVIGILFLGAWPQGILDLAKEAIAAVI